MMSEDNKDSKEACCPNCGTRFKMDADYPWNKCIADQLKRGYSQKDAERICGEIKAKYGS